MLLDDFKTSPTSNAEASRILLQKIDEKGSLSFSEVMEQALYHPQHGYYIDPLRAIGKEGDFYTNVSVGRSYGILLAFCFLDIWEKGDNSLPFILVEQGAHHGTLAEDILLALQEYAPDIFWDNFHYYIIEPKEGFRKKQQQHLTSFTHLSWVESIEALPKIPRGLFFCNELLDAFPCELLCWDGTSWKEKRLCYQKEKKELQWQLFTPQTPFLEEKSKTLPKNLPAPFTLELIPGLPEWLIQLAQKFEKGVLLIADYGMTAQERLLPYRAAGTFVCYYQHQRHTNILENFGKQDITFHLNFSEIWKEAQSVGWNLLGYSDQHHFLTPLVKEWMSHWNPQKLPASQDRRALQTLLHPETMGRSFKFLGLGTNQLSLEAFSYEYPGKAALEDYL